MKLRYNNFNCITSHWDHKRERNVYENRFSCQHITEIFPHVRRRLILGPSEHQQTASPAKITGSKSVIETIPKAEGLVNIRSRRSSSKSHQHKSGNDQTGSENSVSIVEERMLGPDVLYKLMIIEEADPLCVPPLTISFEQSATISCHKSTSGLICSLILLFYLEFLLVL